jgi:hypothetical protein
LYDVDLTPCETNLKVFFLDFYGVFEEDNERLVATALAHNTMQQGDWVFITSSLFPLYLQSSRFYEKHYRRTQICLKRDNPPTQAEVALRFVEDSMIFLCQEANRKYGANVMPRTLCKIAYTDTMRMGLFGFELIPASAMLYTRDIMPFEEI